MMQSDYINFLDNVKGDFDKFVIDATAGIKNKTAALNARKKSMDLRDKLKDFRNKSIDNDKSRTAAKTE